MATTMNVQSTAELNMPLNFIIQDISKLPEFYCVCVCVCVEGGGGQHKR